LRLSPAIFDEVGISTNFSVKSDFQLESGSERESLKTFATDGTEPEPLSFIFFSTY